MKSWATNLRKYWKEHLVHVFLGASSIMVTDILGIVYGMAILAIAALYQIMGFVRAAVVSYHDQQPPSDTPAKDLAYILIGLMVGCVFLLVEMC